MSQRHAETEEDDDLEHSRRDTNRSKASTTRPGSVHSIQRATGNQTLQALAQRDARRAEPTVSQPGDPAEREAERVADRVIRTDSLRTSTWVKRPRPTANACSDSVTGVGDAIARGNPSTVRIVRQAYSNRRGVLNPSQRHLTPTVRSIPVNSSTWVGLNPR